MCKDFNGNEIKPGDRVYYQAYGLVFSVRKTLPLAGRMVLYRPDIGDMSAYPLDCEKVS